MNIYEMYRWENCSACRSASNVHAHNGAIGMKEEREKERKKTAFLAVTGIERKTLNEREKRE